MDFSYLITEAYQITRKNKVLWIFGIISAFFGGAGGFINFSFNLPASLPSGFSSDSGMEKSSEEIAGSFKFLTYIDSWIWLVLASLGLVVILTLVFVTIYLQTWSYAALVSQTLNVIKGKAPAFKEGKEIGEKFFWRIVGFRLLLALPILLVVLLFIVFPLLFFVAGLNVLAIIFIVIEILFFILGIIAYSIVVGLVSEFGLRKMLENDLKVVESIKQGWYLFRDNLGQSLLVWLVNVALGFVLVFPMMFLSIILLIIGVVFFALNPWLVIVPIIVFIIAFTFMGGLWNVFLFSYWSLAYNTILKKPSYAEASEGKGGDFDAAKTNATANTTSSVGSTG